MTIKIFCIYHKDTAIFKSEVVEPIQTGCNFSDIDLGILKDNTRNNIAEKNPYYGELTAWYWVWKNYLKENPDVRYIGFCHYRRFLDFQHKETSQPFSANISAEILSKKFQDKYSVKNILPYIQDYDLILPKKYKMKKKMGTVYEHFISNHPKEEIDKFIDLINKNYPDYKEDTERYLNSTCGYFCLNFVIKREYFEELMNWVFDLLSKMDEITDWSQYDEYLTQRTPAYLIERFINVWINHQIRTKHLKVLERKSFVLCDSITNIIPGISVIKNQAHTTLKIFNIKISKAIQI